MKKLNRKGFTLIELLAIIVILAIIMVVTIPTVLKSMNQAREQSLDNASNTVADWLQKEYELAALGVYAGGADAAYNTFVDGLTGKKISTDSNSTNTLTPALLSAAGIGDGNGLSGEVYYTGSRMCVVLTATATSSFYVSGGSNTGTSSGCE